MYQNESGIEDFNTRVVHGKKRVTVHKPAYDDKTNKERMTHESNWPLQCTGEKSRHLDKLAREVSYSFITLIRREIKRNKREMNCSVMCSRTTSSPYWIYEYFSSFLRKISGNENTKDILHFIAR